jgi:hypothetical protein
MARPPLMRDQSLPHQIVLHFTPGASVQEIGVSCNCRRIKGSTGHYPLASRPRWDDPAEFMAIYRAHLEASGG